MADGNAPKRIFLRKVLYRMDFQFITEQKQEAIYSYIVDEYGEFFDNNGCEQENAVEIEINTDQPDNSAFNKRTQNVYFLTKSKQATGDGRTIKIGRTFIFFDIDLAIQNENLPYYEWFANIIAFIASDLKKMFKPVRMGLRKFNRFYVLHKNIETLDRIFKTPYVDRVESTYFSLDYFDHRQVYSGAEYSINYTRNYSTGILNSTEFDNEQAHLVNFDFDAFTDDIGVLGRFSEDAKTGLTQMNSMIYEFFESIINQEVIKRINSGDVLSDYGIIPF